MSQSRRQGGARLDASRLGRIDWSDGLLLEPLHFRRMESRTDALINYRVEVVFADTWGVVALDGAIVGSRYRVAQVECVMPDGTPLRHPPDDTGGYGPLEIELPEGAGQVHLVLGDINDDLLTSSALATERVVVEIEGQATACRVPRASLFVETEGRRLPARAIALPLLRFEPGPEGPRKQKRGDPPMLRMLPGSDVFAEIEHLCRRLIHKARRRRLEYVEFVRANKHDLAATRRVDLQAINGALVRLREALHRHAHPRELHALLLDAVGWLSALVPAAAEPRMVIYRHEHSAQTLGELVDDLIALLERGIPDNYTMHSLELGPAPPFRGDRGSVAFSVRVDESWVGRQMILAARGMRGVAEERVAEWVKQAHIACESALADVRLERRRGLTRELVDRYQEWIVDEGVIGFVLEPDAKLIVPGQRLFVLNAHAGASDSTPMDMTLYVSHDPGGGGDG